MSEKKIQTCDICKVRHQKCDGVRPTCHHCRIRNIGCVYSSFSAKSRGSSGVASGSSARSKRPPQLAGQDSNTSASSGSYEIDVTLGNLSEDGKIEEILRGELADLNLSPSKKEDIVKSITEQLQYHSRSKTTDDEAPSDSRPAPLLAVSTEQLIDHIITSISMRTGEHSAAILEKLPALNTSTFIPAMMSIPFDQDPTSNTLRLAPSRVEAEACMQSFLQGPNLITPVVTANECVDLFARFYDANTISPREVCLLTHILSTGARYSEDVTQTTYLRWVQQARSQLDYCLNHTKGSQLWIVQPLLLSCMITVQTTPSTCWLLLGLAIRIAQLYRLDQEFEIGGALSAAEHKRSQNLWGSIVFFDVWLSVALGRMPSINTFNSRYVLLRSIHATVKIPEHSVSQNIVGLGIVLGHILRDVYSSTESLQNIHDTYLRLLETWAQHLPVNLRFLQRTSARADEPHSAQDDMSSQRLEIIYLFIVMILTQPFIRASVSSYSKTSVSESASEVRLANTCIDAAVRIGNISRDLGKGGGICKRSWLITSINRHAALLLVLVISSREQSTVPIQGYDGREAAEAGLPAILQVLQFCCEQNEFAKHSLQVIHALCRKIHFTASVVPKPEPSDDVFAPGLGEALPSSKFASYANDPTQLHPLNTSPFGIPAYFNAPQYAEIAFSPQVNSFSGATSRHSSTSQRFADPLAPTPQADGASNLPMGDPYDLSASYYPIWTDLRFYGMPPSDPYGGRDGEGSKRRQ